MPDLGAYKEDVQFNWTGAADLAAELRSTARLLEGQVWERKRIGDRARKQWEGGFAYQFDGRASTCVSDAQRFVTTMSIAADKLDELARLAREEQQRRERAREWAVQQERKNWFEREVVDRFFSDGDVPPPPPPVEPPRIPIGEVASAPREHATGPAPSTAVRGSGRSSADPDDLDGWVTASRGLDEPLTLRQAALGRLQEEFSSRTRWGFFDASSMIGAFKTYIAWNETDARWVANISVTFRRADSCGGVVSVPDAVIHAGLRAAGLTGGRQSVTFDDPVAWGEPPTTGYANDPVNTASGNFVEAEVDFAFDGLLRGLRFVRTFNSRSDRVGPFGRAWASWATARLVAAPDCAHWESPDGQRAVVPLSGEGYRRVAGVHGLVVTGEAGLGIDWFGGGRWQFDAGGLPLWAERGPGTRVRFGYESGRLVSLAHEGGKRLDVEWDGDRVVALSCSDGRRVRYRYDGGGNLVEVDGCLGRRRYTLDSEGRVLSVLDGDGTAELTNTYDAEGRVVAQVSRHGRRSRMRYLPGGVTIVDDEDGGPVNTYLHDEHGRLIGLVDGHGAETTKTYDEWGNPVTVTDRNGAVTLQEWDDRARLVRQARLGGAWFAFRYDESDRVVEVSASTGAATSYRYEGEERAPAEIADPEGAVTRMEVEGGLVRRVVDPDGIEVALGFDADGNVMSVTDGCGGVFAFERDEAGRVTAAVSPSGRRTELAYDALGRLVERRDPGGAVWRFEHTAAGRLAATVDPVGARTETRYGANGEAEALVDALGYVTSRRLDALGNLVAVVLPDGAKWQFTYDALCRLVGVYDPSGGTWLREYDPEGSPAGTVDPLGARRTVSRDELGRVRRVYDGATSVEYEYDELGRAVVLRRSDGTELRASYDRCGRLVSVTDPLGGVTWYEYTPGGRLAGVTSPSGRVVSYEYDEAGRLSAKVDGLGGRWSYRYDGDGLVVAVVAPLGETWRFGYDEAGRFVSRERPDGGVVSYDYDASGRVARVVDATGGVRRFHYDLRGQLARAVDANGGATRYSWNERGWLVRSTDALGGVVERRYDEVGRLVSLVDQLGRATRREYDPAGRLVCVRDAAGGTARWWYDDSGRVTGFGAGDVAEYQVTRDLLGRAVAVDEPGLRHELSWDLCGRLVEKRVGDLALTWRYDADGRRVAVGYPDGSETVFGYDAAGRVVSAQHPGLGIVRVDRDACGRVVGVGSGSGSFRRRWWYWDGELAAVEVDRDGRRRITELARDAAGRVITEIRDGDARRYRYDPAGQLVAMDGADGIRSFAYDLCGRLVAETGPGGVARYSYDAAGQLEAHRCGDSVVTFGYDEAGRRVSEAGPDGGRVFTWDALGRLAGVAGSGRSVRLAVDAFGDLAAVDGVPMLWDPTEPVTQPRWITGRAAVAPSWFDADWQGSVGEGGWDPWGVGALDRGPALGWRGELAVGGLVWLRNRCYDPVTRAFLSIDPLPGIPGMPSSGNPYHYAHNDPLNWLDPLGLRPVTDAELAAYRDAHTGTIGSWLTDHWGEIATVGLVVVGSALVLTGAGTAAGVGILVGVGSSTLAQYATTGEVDWGKVAVSGVVGMVAGGVGGAVGLHSSVLSASGQLAARGHTVIGGLTPYVAGGSASGFTSGVLNETADWRRGGSFDVDVVAAETLAGGFFGALGGAAPVADELLTGTVSNQARNLERVAGAAGGIWTENVKEMAEHGIEPLPLWPALPSP